MGDSAITTSSIILLAKTKQANKYIFGAYTDDGKATSFLKLPEDRKMFEETLVNRQTVMGRNTFNATPTDFPDAGRICITHHPEKVGDKGIPAATIKEGIAIAKKRAQKAGQNIIYVIGGANIIKQCLEENLLDEIKLTLTYDHRPNVENPVYLDFNLDNWNIAEDSGIMISKNSEPKDLKYRYLRIVPRRVAE